MKLDILGIVAHPDDIELSAAGTFIKHIKMDKKAGIIDLTRGELGTRGSAELRAEEAKKASEIMKLAHRSNLEMKDGFFAINEENTLKVIQQIRRFQPEIVITNAIDDRHPDHGRGAKLVAEACFLSNLRRIESTFEGKKQGNWKPKLVLHCIQDYYIKPDIVVDISNEWDEKMNAIKAFKSQFYDPNSAEPSSPIAQKDFFNFLEGRAKQFARPAGIEYAEGFTSHRLLGIDNLFHIL